MKILIVNYRYFVSGGPEKYMFNIMSKLRENGHEIINFSVNSTKNEPSAYEKYFVSPIGGMDQVYFEDYKKTPKTVMQLLGRSFYSLEVKNAVKRIIRDTEPDVVYILHYVNKLSPSVIRGAKEMGKRVVVRLSDYFLLCPRFDFLCGNEVCEDCLTRGYVSCIKKRCVKGSLAASLIRTASMRFHKMIDVYKNVDAFITPSAFMREKLLENGFDRVHNILTFTSDVDYSLNKPGSYGLYVGRMTQEKGVSSLVKAYTMLSPEHKLYVAADDSTKEAREIIRYAKEHGLDNVVFTGFLSGNELTDMVLNSRFVCVPSIWYENIPNVILEAHAAAKPVLCSRLGSLTELIENGRNGLLFKPGSSEEIASCIEQMDDDSLVTEMSVNARRSFEERYTWDVHYNKLIKLLSNEQ